MIRNKCNARTAHTINHWRHEVSGSHWDAIVVDVQILGSAETGTDHAEHAIWEYMITSPVIVISGVWRPEILKKRHRGIFFDYIPKDDFNVRLPKAIEKACSMDHRREHVKTMLIAFAKKFKLLKKEFPLDWLVVGQFRQLLESRNGKTVRDLINTMWGGTKKQINDAGRTVFIVMHKLSERPT